MKVNVKKVFVCTIVFIITILISGGVQAKSYSIENMDIQATINNDGSVSISQSITYKFNGSYNGIYINIPYVLDDEEYGEIGEKQQLNENLYTGNGITVQNVTDTTSKIDYYLKKRASNGDKNVYTLNKENGIEQIKVYSPSTDTTKTFIIDYTINNLCVKHKDIGELYYNFIGGAWEVKIKKLNIDVYLPNNLRRYLYMGTWTI